MNKKMALLLLLILFASGGIGIFFILSMLSPSGINPGIFFLPKTSQPTTSEKWALIVCSDTSFHSEYPPTDWYDLGAFKTGGLAPPYNYAGQYYYIPNTNPNGFHDPFHGCDIPSHSGVPCINISNTASHDYNFWTSFDFVNYIGTNPPFVINDPLEYINFTVCINTTNAQGQSGIPPPMLPPNPLGGGAYLGIVWLNAVNNVLNATYSLNIIGTTPWTPYTLLAQPAIESPLAVKFATIMVLEGVGDAYFDDAQLSFIPNATLGGSPNYDGFPAQALQAYNACRTHGFDDYHIMMMIDSGDHQVDINATDSITNDYAYYENLYPGCYDYIDGNVTKENFTREMNASIEGSWASKINSTTSVMIYMINHGSQINSTDAVFHFPRSNDNITEAEMKALLDQINCSRLALFVDCCFSGNFIDSLDATNRIQVAASASGRLAWFWTMATVNHWAGSWYFHPFWDELKSGKSIAQANTTALNYIPWAQWNDVDTIQGPIVRDSSGTLGSWNPLL
ncbi:MAG: C13 family peptidase [Candidatus Helarchaeota archaeon]